MNALAWTTQQTTSAVAWINYMAKQARKAHGEEDEPARPGRAQAEHDEHVRTSVIEAYERIVSNSKRGK